MLRQAQHEGSFSNVTSSGLILSLSKDEALSARAP
jgi:hypothetical protein